MESELKKNKKKLAELSADLISSISSYAMEEKKSKHGGLYSYGLAARPGERTYWVTLCEDPSLEHALDPKDLLRFDEVTIAPDGKLKATTVKAKVQASFSWSILF